MTVPPPVVFHHIFQHNCDDKKERCDFLAQMHYKLFGSYAFCWGTYSTQPDPRCIYEVGLSEERMSKGKTEKRRRGRKKGNGRERGKREAEGKLLSPSMPSY